MSIDTTTPISSVRINGVNVPLSSSGGGSSSGVYKGTFDNFTAVPSTGSSYEGGTAPVNNDYIMVKDCSDHYSMASLDYSTITEIVTYTHGDYSEDISINDISGYENRILIDNAFYIYYDSYANRFDIETVISLIIDGDPIDGSNVLTISTNDDFSTSIEYYGDNSGAMFIYNGVWSSVGKNGWVQIMPIVNKPTYLHNITITGATTPHYGPNYDDAFQFDVRLRLYSTDKEPIMTLSQIYNTAYIQNNSFNGISCEDGATSYDDGNNYPIDCIIKSVSVYENIDTFTGEIKFYIIDNNVLTLYFYEFDESTIDYIGDDVQPI